MRREVGAVVRRIANRWSARPVGLPSSVRSGVARRRATSEWVARLASVAGCGVALATPLAPAPVAGQVREIVSGEAVFWKAPGGVRLAELERGARVAVRGADGSWTQVLLEGWVPSSAIGATSREGHNGVITTSGGEPLRTSAGGARAGLLLEGFLLDRMEDRDGWSRVQRVGWVRSAELGPASAAGSLDGVARQGGVGGDGVAPAGVETGRAGTVRGLTAGETALRLHAAPGGRASAAVEPGTPITVLERRDGWTRVRVEGWTPSARVVTAGADEEVVGVSAADLRANPDDYAGVRLRWSVQFIALQQAGPERLDFYEGEPFILARPPDAGHGLVYVAVPPELLDAAGTLQPLAMIDIVAQVRTGRSALMGAPVLDLLALP